MRPLAQYRFHRVALAIGIWGVSVLIAPSAGAQTLTLTVSPSTITFAAADPDTTPSIAASSITVSYRVRNNAAGSWRISLLASGDLTAGSATIPITNVTWTASPTPRFQAGTLSRTPGPDAGVRIGQRPEHDDGHGCIQIGELMDLQRQQLFHLGGLHPDGPVMRHALRIAVVLLLSAPAAAGALHLFSVEVTPLRVELKVGAGAAHTQAVTLKNESKKGVRIRARVDDWYLSKDGTPQFKPVDAADRYSAAAWVRLNPPEQLVSPGATAVVRFTTTVPKDAKEGGYRCAIMFEFDPPDADPATKGRDVMFRGAHGDPGVHHRGRSHPVGRSERISRCARLRAAPPKSCARHRRTAAAHTCARRASSSSTEPGRSCARCQFPMCPCFPRANAMSAS